MDPCCLWDYYDYPVTIKDCMPLGRDMGKVILSLDKSMEELREYKPWKKENNQELQ